MDIKKKRKIYELLGWWHINNEITDHITDEIEEIIDGVDY